MEAGKKLARIVDYGVTESGTGKSQAYIKFEVEGETFNWYGTFLTNNGEPNTITLNSLAYCGLKNLDNFANGLESGELVTDEDIEITLALEMGPNGNRFLKVKYVGEGKEVKKLSKAEAETKIPKSVNAKLQELLKGRPEKKKKDPELQVPF